MKKTYQLETLTCPSCVAKIENMLKHMEGINESKILFMSSKVKVDFDENLITSEDIKNNIDKLGYQVLGEK